MVKQIINTPAFLDEHLPTNTLGEKADLTLLDEKTLTPAELERLCQAAVIYKNSLSGAKQESVTDLDIKFAYPAQVSVLTEKSQKPESNSGMSEGDFSTRIPLAQFLAPEPLSTEALNVFLGPRGHLPRSNMFAGELSKLDLPDSSWIQQIKADAELGHEIHQEEGETRVYGAGRDSIGVGLRIYIGGSKRIVTKVTKGDVYNVIETY